MIVPEKVLFSVIAVSPAARARALRSAATEHCGRLTLRPRESVCGLTVDPAGMAGMQPVSRLPERLSEAPSWVSSPGMLPVSRLPLRFRVNRLRRSPSSAGIGPVSRLAPRWRTWSPESRPSPAGSTPSSFRAPNREPSRFRDHTRFRSRLTPDQPEIARPPDQSSLPGEIRTVPRSASLSASSAVQSPTRPVLVAGFGTATPLRHCVGVPVTVAAAPAPATLRARTPAV